jgi:hypothetical protein
MKTRPRKPRLLREVNNGANGMTNFGDIRLLERFIYETPRPLIGSPLVGWSPAGRSF